MTTSGRHKVCTQCGKDDAIKRIDEFDAYACRHCMAWVDDVCGQEKCFYCPHRPPTPVAVDWDDPMNTGNPA